MSTPPSSANVTFVYGCAGWGDPVCDGYDIDDDFNRVRDIELPTRIALGAEFDMEFRLNHNPENLFSAAEHILERTEGGFLGVGEGRTAVYVVRSDGVLPGYEYFDVIAPADIRIEGDIGEVSSVGDLIDVQATLVDDEGRALAGAQPWTWTSTAPEVVQVTAGDPRVQGSEVDDAAMIEVLGTGAATVRVSAAGLEVELPFTVQ